MHYAVLHKVGAVVELLVNKGALANTANLAGETAYDLAWRLTKEPHGYNVRVLEKILSIFDKNEESENDELGDSTDNENGINTNADTNTDANVLTLPVTNTTEHNTIEVLAQGFFPLENDH